MRARPIAALLLASPLALLSPAGTGVAAGAGPISRVAVFPVENLSGGGIPEEEIRRVLAERLAAAGVETVADDVLADFITRRRIRYTAGVDDETAAALRQDAGADGVLIASVELLDDTVPPKVALMARLISINARPTIVWADDVGMSGDDAPGLLGRGLVDDFGDLLDRALNRVADSLVRHVTTGEMAGAVKGETKFRPRTFYRRVAIEPGRTYSVAVLPFFNRSDRRGAGEILGLLFARHLSVLGGFLVVEAGETRQQLLRARVIMDGGVSLEDAEVVAAGLEADFVLAGRVLSYEDQEGPAANPRVEFSTVLIERTSGRVVWSSSSCNEGHDGVRFFGRGRSGTAHAMATRMVGLAAEMIARGSR